jgi:DNA modification methylase
MFKRVRLIRADTFEYLPTMPANSIDCVVTSPPYWAQTDFNSKGDRYGNAPTLSAYRAQTRVLCRELHRIMNETGSLWVNMGYKREAGRLIDLPALWAQDAEQEGFLLRQRIVWDKSSSPPTAGTRRERDGHEIVLHLVKNIDHYYYDISGARAPYRNAKQSNPRKQHHKVYKWAAEGALTYSQSLKAHAEIDRRTKAGENNRIRLHLSSEPGNFNQDGFYFEGGNENGAIGTNIWRMPPSRVGGLSHPCPFPVELALRCIRRTCSREGVAFDPFMGSGTTAVAAQSLNRRVIGIEIMREHWETAISRVGKIVVSDSRTPVASSAQQTATVQD